MRCRIRKESKNGGEDETGLIALPWAYLKGSTFAAACPTQPRKNATLVAVPARRAADGRGWVVDLRFDQPPRTHQPVERVDWRHRDVLDSPAGLEHVTLRVTYRRWRSTDRREYFTSPVPVALKVSGEKVTPALRAYARQTLTRLDLPTLHVARAVNLDRRLLRALRAPGLDFVYDLQTVPGGAMRRPATMPRLLAIDEIYLGRTYWTVVTDNVTRRGLPLGQRVIGLCQGRSQEAILPMLRQLADWYREDHQAGLLQDPRPERVSADLWLDFWQALREADVFTPEVTFSTDRFHLMKRIRETWQAAQAACGPCSPCTRGQPCERRRRNRAHHDLLEQLWKVEWADFAREWQALRSTVPKTEDDYSALNRLLSWRWDVLQQTFEHSERPANGRAEAINRRIRVTLKQMRRTGPDDPPLALLQQLHAQPALPAMEAVAVLPPSLPCPQCGAPVHAQGTRRRRVQLLPRGLTPLQLDLPAVLTCTGCGPCTPPWSEDGLTPELRRWLLDPLQRALPVATVARLVALSPRRLLTLQGPATPQSAAGRLGTGPMVYDEIWTARRVWSILATPGGQLIDLAVLDRRTWTAQEKAPPDAHLFQRADTVHHAVARQAVRLLRKYSQGNRRQVVLHVEYLPLFQALHWKPKAPPEGSVLDDRTALNEYRYAFTAAPYVLHEFPRRGWREVQRYVRAQCLGTEQDMEALLKQPLDQWKAHPMWQRLTPLPAVGQNNVSRSDRETQVMGQLLRDAALLKRLLQGREAEVRAALGREGRTVPQEGKGVALLGAYFTLGPRPAGGDSRPSPADLKRHQFWDMLEVVRPLLLTTLTSPPPATPHHPQLLNELTWLLQDALHLPAHEQRLRVMAALQAQCALRGQVWLPGSPAGGRRRTARNRVTAPLQ